MALTISAGMSVLLGYFAVQPIRERTEKSKHLQFVSGATTFGYWVPTFTVDLVLFCVTTIVPMVISFFLYDKGVFTTGIEIARWSLVIFVFGIPSLSMTYLLTFLFQKPATGYSYTVLFNFVIGIVAYIVYMIIDSFSTDSDWIRYMFQFSPTFSIGTMGRRMYMLSKFEECSAKCENLPWENCRIERCDINDYECCCKYLLFMTQNR